MNKKSVLVLSFFVIVLLAVSVEGDYVCDIGEAECSDGLDNDGDSLIDFTGACHDMGLFMNCAELGYNTVVECQAYCADGNNMPSGGPGVYTGPDPECRSPLDTDESSDPECADGGDNDGNGDIDFPNDPDCTAPEDDSESGGVAPAPEVSQNAFVSLWNWFTSLVS